MGAATTTLWPSKMAAMACRWKGNRSSPRKVRALGCFLPARTVSWAEDTRPRDIDGTCSPEPLASSALRVGCPRHAHPRPLPPAPPRRGPPRAGLWSNPTTQRLSYAEVQSLNPGVNVDWVVREFPNARMSRDRAGRVRQTEHGVTDPYGKSQSLFLDFNECGVCVKKTYSGTVVRPPPK